MGLDNTVQSSGVMIQLCAEAPANQLSSQQNSLFEDLNQTDE